jgi:hypothetical protein
VIAPALQPAWLPAHRRRAIRDGLWLLAVVALIAYLAAFVVPLWLGQDGHAYWQAWQGPSLYAAPPASADAFLYAPIFAQLVRPLALLPWPAFLAAWAVIQAAVFYWLLRPLPRAWFVLALLACLPEVLEANVNGLLALAIVLSFLTPASWAFPILTKVAPGVGLIWYAVRGEWRALAVALGAVGIAVAVSFAIWPAAWFAWLAFLGDNLGAGGGKTSLLPIRIAFAALVVAWGARTDRRWALAPAVVLASPVLFLNTFTILAAVPRLRRVGMRPVAV